MTERQARIDRLAESFDTAFAKVKAQSDARAEMAMGFHQPPPAEAGPTSPDFMAAYQPASQEPGRPLYATPTAPPAEPLLAPAFDPRSTDPATYLAARLAVPPKRDIAREKEQAQTMSGHGQRVPQLSDDQQRWARIAGAGSSSYANLRSKS